MILEILSVTDFRVFEGQHSFDLAPGTRRNKKRPVVLFGGLNGAGKTTTLTAVRLALYGKQSLGAGTSQKEYERYLEKSIHRSKGSLVKANAARIELTFSYASMGIVKHYTVQRQWVVNGKKLVEELSIAEDGEVLDELNHEQCQGFLNELIPIGVSELFFFDGEKIADLAEDTGGLALGDSIKKLLGLDLIDTLNADLSLLVRNESKKSASASLRKEIDALEVQLGKYENNAEKAIENWRQCKAQTVECNVKLDQYENELTSRGGAWAATREHQLVKEVELRTEKQHLETQLRDLISNLYPLSLAGKIAKATLKQLHRESQQTKQRDTIERIEKHLLSLDHKLSGLLDEDTYDRVNKIISNEFKATVTKKKVTVIHDLSDSAIGNIESMLDTAVTQQNKKAKYLAESLDKIGHDLDKVGLNIARAPEESTLKPAMNKIKNEQEKQTQSRVKESKYLEEHKRALRQSMDIVRKLDKISETFSSDEKKNRTLLYANKSRALLKDFSQEMAKRKIQDLEHEFINSFNSLARKDDISLSTEIDPNTFAVKLIDGDQQEIDKNDLSAGEKQIYAISILEALGKTSGRKLPIIIDTPLGRLDSKHRTNLIENYFPSASHQVIILSTDTEVDEPFYVDLSSSISHAYKLDYDSKSGSTTAKKGYFWKNKTKETV